MLNENPESAREIDQNGYLLVKDNPIICAGVFPYNGASLPGGEPGKIYQVYRPIEELSKPDTLESLRGLPIIDEHEMLGDRYQRSPEERGVHGSVLENISLKGRDILANLRIWSRTLKSLLDAGKKGLSLGYNCRFEKSSGVFEGMPYDYIQRNIRGNHLALVTQGRNGTAVLDQQDVFDHFDLALDKTETDMADDDKKDEKAKNDAPSKENPSKDKEGEMSMADVTAAITKLMPVLEAIEEIRGMVSKSKDADVEALDGDTEKKSGDQAKDEKDEKDCKAMDTTKDKAMDAAEIGALVDTKLKAERKNMLGDITKRDALAKDLVPLIGSFDHSAMDSAEVAKYGIEKLGLSVEKGHEASALSSYLAGRKASNSKDGFALDSALPKPKEGGLLTKRLNTAA